MFKKENKNSEIPEGFKRMHHDFKEKTKKNLVLDAIKKQRFTTISKTMNLATDFPISHLENYPENLKAQVIMWLKKDYAIESINELIEGIFTTDILTQHFACIGIRKLLGIDKNVKQILFDRNCVPKLIEFARNNEMTHLQLEATWSLTNMCLDNSDNVRKMVQKGIIDLFIEVAKNSYPEIAEQAIWGLGNIAGDNDYHFKNLIIRSDAIKVLTDVYINSSELNLKNNIIWVFSNLARLKKDENPDNLKDARVFLEPTLFIMLEKFILTDNEEIKEECIIGLTPYAKGKFLKNFISLEFLTKLKMFLDTQMIKPDPNVNLISSILSLVGNITSSEDDSFTDQVLAVNFVESFSQLLNCQNEDLQKKTCWIFCNIAIGTEAQKQMIIHQNGLIHKFMEMINKSKKNLAQEALWILCSLCNSKNNDILMFLINMNLLHIFYQVLDKTPDVKDSHKSMVIILEALEFMLEYFKSCNNLKAFTERLIIEGIADKLELLQNSISESVYLKSLNILENYFEIDEDFPY